MDLSTANVATILTLLVAAVGAVVVIVQPSTLDFATYFDDIKILIAGLAVGRGLAATKS